MLFVIIALDRPGALDQRIQVRPAHLDFLTRGSARIRVGGPCATTARSRRAVFW
jgi:uncharacterized protein YciI